MNAATSKTPAVAPVKDGSQALAIPEDEAIRVLQNSIYPGARPESIRLVLAWCRASGRDPLKKPIHIVPMNVRNAVTGRDEWRDVLMPGIGTYRSDAASSGNYAGKGEPEFGPDVTGNFDGMKVTHPLWCRVTVHRIVHGQSRAFTAKEFWVENYATGKGGQGVNAMWRKRPYGQLAKVAEAQALRMAFPDETGNTNTSEEMEGKSFEGTTIDVETPKDAHKTIKSERYEAKPDEIEADQPKKRTTRDWLNNLYQTLQACHTAEEVETIAAADQTIKALAALRGGALEELEAMLAEAEARVNKPDEPPPSTEVDDDRFPLDVPLPE